MTRELTWRPVPFDAKVPDLFDGTQVAELLLKLEHSDESCRAPAAEAPPALAPEVAAIEALV